MRKDKSTIMLLLKVWKHMRPVRRVQLGLLLIVMLASGGAEIGTLGAFIPILGGLSNKEQLTETGFLNGIATRYSLSEQSILVITIALFGITVLVAAVIRLANLWLNLRLGGAIGADLSCKAFGRILEQPYEKHIWRSSASVITALTKHIAVTIHALNSVLQMLTALIVSAGLLGGLVFIDWQGAFIAAVFFGVAYGAIALNTSYELKLNGEKLADAAKNQLKILQESLGGIREVLLSGNQKYYEDMYRETESNRNIFQARNGFLSLFPRYIIEAGGLICLSVIGVYLMLQHSNRDLMPILGAIALGAQRLLPSLQQIYGGWATVKSSSAAIECIVDVLDEPSVSNTINDNKAYLRHKIQFQKVDFKYKDDGEDILSKVDWEIGKGERIGIIGNSGAGKSTVIDILVGLLKPQGGKILIDGFDLYDADFPGLLQSWRAAVAYVPQSVYLADRSVYENIAFGENIDNIDYHRVKEAARGAQIASYIESMPSGYDSFVGERGIRLSGGQRQRIGVARALYKKSQIIIFDEATSALDNDTEGHVLSGISQINKNVTIIMVAHRLSTLRLCDKIFKVEKGRICLVPKQI